jgi:hypothetical protein
VCAGEIDTLLTHTLTRVEELRATDPMDVGVPVD